MAMKWPASCKIITQRYGNKSSRYVGGYHTGVDIGCKAGSPIYAAHDGKVVVAGWKGAYGNTVELAANDSFYTSYHHMSRIAARVGQNVSAGSVIGYIGSTGQSTGPHLHFEVRKGGKAVDPMPYLNGAAIPSGGGIVQAGITDDILGVSQAVAVYDTLKATAGVFEWLTDTKNWYRIGLVFAGAILVYLTLVGIAKGKVMSAVAGDTAKAVTGTAKKIGKKVSKGGSNPAGTGK